MKKFLCCALAACLLAGLFAGCAAPAGESKELNLFIWTEYIPQTVLDQFKEETGITVNISTYSSNEDALAKVKASNEGIYDIVVPSDYMVKMMASQGLLAEINKDSIPNLKNIGQQYLDQSFDKGNKYSVPYMGGVATLCYNSATLGGDITTYSQIFDPKYKSSIVLLDDSRAVIGMVAKSMGYTFNETDPATLDKVGEKLMELKPNVKAFDSDSPKSKMVRGETSIGFMWNAEAALAIEEDPDIKIVYPAEGCYLFLDNLCILKGAKNAGNAEKFIDFIYRPEISKMISEAYPYLNPNIEAVKLLGDAYLGNPAKNIPAEVFAKGEYIQDVGEAVSLYDTIWTEFTN